MKEKNKAKNYNMKVTIITVSYNSEKTIEDTIKSVLSQDYKNIEFIIIDGDSNDGTKKILNKYSSNISNIISEKDDGIYDAMNKGIRIASGDIIAILNSDDIYFDKYVISSVVKSFIENNCNIVFGNIQYVSENNLEKVVRNWISSPYVPNSFKNGWHPPHPAFFVKKDIYIKHGNFDIEFNIAADFDLMYRFLEIKNVKSVFIDNFLVKMRLGGESNKSLRNIYIGNRQVINSFKKYNKSVSFFYPFYRLIPKLKQYFDER